ncbi:MAG: DUF445 family protein [Thermodesulfobacteriota bacterium]
MSLPTVELSVLASYLAPPVLGAFIGYLTNKVAIKMLFRPLKPWIVMGRRVPMTPGVIPSKRHDLAINIGEMVGEHLLTSKEIGGALKRDSFQSELYRLIESRGGDILHRDYGSLEDIVPTRYKNYLEAAVQAITAQLQENLHHFTRSEVFTTLIIKVADEQFDRLLDKEFDRVLAGGEREKVYGFIETNIGRLLADPATEEWVTLFIQQKVYQVLQQNRSLDDILPESLTHLIIETIENQTPALLEKLAEILKEPAVRDKIVVAVCGGIENFIDSMGAMGSMVSGFISMESVAEKIREYLEDKEDEIQAWLHNPEARERVASVLRERTEAFLKNPIAEMLGEGRDAEVDKFCNGLAVQVMGLLREQETTAALTAMIKDSIEAHIQEGKLPLREVFFDLVGEEGTEKTRQWLKDEFIELLQSTQSRKAVNSMVERLIGDLLKKAIGRPSRLLPAGVRDGIYQSVQQAASNMLAVEVPGLVDSLNIRQIVSDKVDSLDLLRLERLLLSIMEEQFKYINLFGALLGFLIGCLNLIFLRFL